MNFDLFTHCLVDHDLDPTLDIISVQVMGYKKKAQVLMAASVLAILAAVSGLHLYTCINEECERIAAIPLGNYIT